MVTFSASGARVEPQIVTVTIATHSHLGDARTFARMLHRQHPGARCFLLVVDRDNIDPLRDTLVGFEVVALSQLRIPSQKAYCFQYTAFELCNALKPLFLRWVLGQRGVSAALYLDSDIGVFSVLDALWADLLRHDILLTRHTWSGYPNDGHFPDDAALEWAGLYNGGVIGVCAGATGFRFLDWWAARLYHDCLDDPPRGFFVDQKPLDLVPAYFENVGLCSHDGVNVAHFNLHERRLTRGDSGWLVNGVPLLLFHFTCIDVERRQLLPPVTRPLFAAQPLLRELVAEYADDWAKSGSRTYRNSPYGYAEFTSGHPISLEARRAFRDAWLAGILMGDPFRGRQSQ